MKTIISIVLTIIIIFAGGWLHKTGKPYHDGIFALHKLATVGFLILFVTQLNTYIKVSGVNGLLILFITIGIMSIALLIISGGFMALNKKHELMLTIHKTATIGFLIGISYLIFKLIKG